MLTSTMQFGRVCLALGLVLHVEGAAHAMRPRQPALSPPSSTVAPCELVESMNGWASSAAASLRQTSPAAVTRLSNRMATLSKFCASRLPRLAHSLPVLCSGQVLEPWNVRSSFCNVAPMSHNVLGASMLLDRPIFRHGPPHGAWLLPRRASVRPASLDSRRGPQSAGSQPQLSSVYLRIPSSSAQVRASRRLPHGRSWLLRISCLHPTRQRVRLHVLSGASACA